MQKPVRIGSGSDDLEPLVVPIHVAQRLAGASKSGFLRMRKSGLVRTVKVGTREMVVYASLKRLADPEAA